MASSITPETPFCWRIFSKFFIFIFFNNYINECDYVNDNWFSANFKELYSNSNHFKSRNDWNLIFKLNNVLDISPGLKNFGKRKVLKNEKIVL